MQNIKSNKIYLKEDEKTILEFDFTGFPYLAIWYFHIFSLQNLWDLICHLIYVPFFPPIHKILFYIYI